MAKLLRVAFHLTTGGFVGVLAMLVFRPWPFDPAHLQFNRLFVLAFVLAGLFSTMTQLSRHARTARHVAVRKGAARRDGA